MEKNYDVVVVGGGPAGLDISSNLGRSLKVCLIDNKTELTDVTYNTFASYLDIQKYGFSENIIASTISEICFYSKHFNFKKKGKLHIINKESYFKELLERSIKNNIQIASSTHAESFSLNEDGSINSITDSNGNIFKAKIFVDASGVSGFFSRKIGLMDQNLETGSGLEYNCEYLGDEAQMHLFIGTLYEKGYGWLFPLGNRRAIIGLGSKDVKIKEELKKRLDLMFLEKSIKNMVKKDNENLMGGSIPITKVKTNFVYKNIVCIGDSVSQVNPLVGEGQRFILDSAILAASAIIKSIENNDLAILREYQDQWREKFYRQYLACKRIQKLAMFVSKSDLLCDLGTLILKTKKDERFVSIIAGEI